MGVQGALKGAQANLIFVADVEQSDGAFFVEPRLKFVGGDFRGGMAGGVDSFHTKADDLPLNFDEHSLKGLI